MTGMTDLHVPSLKFKRHPCQELEKLSWGDCAQSDFPLQFSSGVV